MKHTRLISLLIPVLAAGLAGHAADDEQDKLPPHEFTEYWEPVPPVVSAPEGGIPSDAIVLFDGTDLDEWEMVDERARPWIVADGAMTVAPQEKIGEKRINGDIRTKRAFGDCQLHIEFRTPPDDDGKSQGKGNSGVFLMGLYELQVLDSYQNATYVNGQAGSIYKQHPPLVNASRPAGEWQSYDIIFMAPRFDEEGNLIRPGRMTALHNGVLVQHFALIYGPTAWRGLPKYHPHPAKLPLMLQDHGDRVSYRNIWIRELNLPSPEL